MTIRDHVTVQPGGTIEVQHPELPTGARVEVTIRVEPAGEPEPLSSFLGKGGGCFASAEEADAFIRAEREAWER